MEKAQVYHIYGPCQTVGLLFAKNSQKKSNKRLQTIAKKNGFVYMTPKGHINRYQDTPIGIS